MSEDEPYRAEDIYIKFEKLMVEFRYGGEIQTSDL